MFKKKSNILYLILSIILSLLIHPILLIAVIYFWIKEYYNFKIYNYRTNKDYDYNLRKDEIKITLKDNTFELPSYIDENYTLTLKINIKSNFISKFVMPFISVSNSEKKCSQYFEYYAQGVRFLNITSFINKNKMIQLKESNLKFDKNDITLFIHKNIELKNKEILFLSSHPDDAEIAGYGLYSKYNNNTHIVNISAGDSGTYIKNNSEISLSDAQKHKGKLRLIDSLTAPLFADVPQNHIYNLGYKDSKFKELYKNKVEHTNFKYYRNFNINHLDDCEHTWDSLVNDLSKIIENIQPDIIVTPHPQIDSNSDHQYTTLALKQALDNINYKKESKILLYSNHLTNTEAYPFGKEHSIMPIPPVFKEDNFYFEDLLSLNLSHFLQVEKYYALESIHDIRAIDVNSTFFSTLKFEFRKAKKKFWGNHFYYYRRAVKDNEIFFVIDKKNLDKSIEGI